MKKTGYKMIFLHAGIWMVVFGLHYFFFPILFPPANPVPLEPNSPFNPQILQPIGMQPHGAPIFELITNYLFLIGFYYLHLYVLIPKFLARQQKLNYFLSVGGSFLVFFALVYVPQLLTHPDLPTNRRVLMVFLLLISLVFIASGTGNIITRWFASEKRAKEIELEKIRTELFFLKAQINPHFLFNTLNNIYSLAIKKSDKTADAIIKLSDMMRYVLSDAKSDTVPLEKEITYINKYIDLQKMRLTSKVTVDYKVTGYNQQVQIAPLILMPFIENAFKYGISTHDESVITVSILLADNHLTLFTSNRIFNLDSILIESNGIGIANAKRRLSLLYPESHSLKIDIGNEFYVVKLDIYL